jgi:hypothetical protein
MLASRAGCPHPSSCFIGSLSRLGLHAKGPLLSRRPARAAGCADRLRASLRGALCPDAPKPLYGLPTKGPARPSPSGRDAVGAVRPHRRDGLGQMSEPGPPPRFTTPVAGLAAREDTRTVARRARGVSRVQSTGSTSAAKLSTMARCRSAADRQGDGSPAAARG